MISLILADIGDDEIGDESQSESDSGSSGSGSDRFVDNATHNTFTAPNPFISLNSNI
jgi:hypothetical protein